MTLINSISKIGSVKQSSYKTLNNQVSSNEKYGNNKTQFNPVGAALGFVIGALNGIVVGGLNGGAEGFFAGAAREGYLYIF